METQLDSLNAKSFAANLHSKFKAQLQDGTALELTLSEVEEHTSAPKLEVFFLRFLGPRSPRLAQRTYQLDHEKLGSFQIFLTAISEDGNGVCYESVVNRFRK